MNTKSFIFVRSLNRLQLLVTEQQLADVYDIIMKLRQVSLLIVSAQSLDSWSMVSARNHDLKPASS